ncbi:MAG: hypothetical protein Q4P33_04870 [Flaviflexus sp.]|nr:hypothetical protein [Flaviflexus sp.]
MTGLGPVAMGLNYTPSKGWFHSWAHPDWGKIDEDFAAIASLGADHIRIFPLWPLLQPNRSYIDAEALKNVRTMVDRAGEHGLDVSVDCLQGHLSSYDFLPSWLTSWHRTNLFTDPRALEGQEALVGAICREIKGAENCTGVTLGNEFIQFAAPRHPFRHEVDAAGARAWTERLLAAARDAWPEGHHHHSYDDDLWFIDDHPFTPDLAELGDSTTVHSWVFMAAGRALGKDHPALPAFARYLIELACAWSDKPIWLQEVGAPITWVDDAPAFVEGTCAAVGDHPRLAGITWWCSHDVSPTLADFPNLEYHLGLISPDNEIKPAGQAFTREVEKMPERRRTASEDWAQLDALVVPSDPARRSLAAPGSATFFRWAESWAQGQPLRLTREDSMA